MSYLFFDDFKSCDERGRACGWTILRNSDLAHEHRDWNPGEYIITATGNRHLPNVPELSAFTLATAFAVNDNIADHPEFRVYFHYDGLRGSGRFVSCRLEKGQCVAALGTESANAAAQIIETQSAPFAAERRVSPWNLSVKVADGRAELRFEDCPPFAFRLPECGAGKGRIAIDRGDFHG